MSTSWNAPSTLYLVDVKIKSVLIEGINFSTVLRVGWLGTEAATYTRWKKAHNGSVSWKKSLVLRVEPSQEFITLVLYQKVGERSNAIAMKQMPCQVCFDGPIKHQFNFPWDYLADGSQGEIQGSIRASPQADLAGFEHQMGGSRSFAHMNSSVMAMDGSPNMSRSRSWLLQKNNTISLTNSCSTLPSVDLSLDFLPYVPNEFWPLITFVEVYTSVLKQHEDKLRLQDNAIQFLAALDPNTKEFEIPAENQKPLGEGGKGFVEVFLELGLLLNTSVSNETGVYSCWSIDDRVCELPSLQDAIEIFIQQNQMTD